MSKTICAFNHREWSDNIPDDFTNGMLDVAEYVNQEEDYCDSLRGEWFSIPEEMILERFAVIFHGTFGNDHSPGAGSYTYAEVYDMHDPEDNAEYYHDKACWECKPEYVDE